MLSSNALVIIDPGLMEAGGHHAGFALSLVNSHEFKKQNRKVRLYCHKALDLNLENQISETNIIINKKFTTNFYQQFELNSSIANAHTFISKLSIEYFSVLLELEKSADKQKTVCFYPCLSWEHANALNLALVKLAQLHNVNEKFKCEHIVCAMFNPGVNDIGEIINFVKANKFKYAFSSLIKQQNVHLYASEQELSNAYKYLLNLGFELPIHPCFFINTEKAINKIELNKRENVTKEQIILYLGDAKVNKGFVNLPQVIENVMQSKLAHYKLIVQYTLAWEYPEIDNTIVELQKLAHKHSNLILINKFWSEDELFSYLSSSKAMLLAYNNIEYQHKSSGLLWLGVLFNLPIIVNNSSWLTREGERLNAHIVYMESMETLNNIDFNSLQNVNKNDNNNQYKQQIYQAFIPWLSKQQESILHA
jgi:hypothetical protein